MEPLYKIGDFVLIKSEYDLGKDSWDYPCIFTDEMITDYGGRLLKVINVSFSRALGVYVYKLEDNY